MKTSAQCPVCHGRLSLWTGLRAPTPFRITCPHCRTGLRTHMRGLWLVFTLMVVLFSAGAAGCVAAFLVHGRRGLLLALAGLLAFWFASELVTGVVFYTHAQLIPEQGDGSAQPAAATDERSEDGPQER